MSMGTWSTLSSRGSPPSRERVSDREVRGSLVDNPRNKGVNERRNRVTNVCKGEEDQEGEVTDNGSLEKGTVKGSVFPGEVTLCIRYLTYGGQPRCSRVPGTFSPPLSRVVSRLFTPCMVQYQVQSIQTNSPANETSIYI